MYRINQKDPPDQFTGINSK